MFFLPTPLLRKSRLERLKLILELWRKQTGAVPAHAGVLEKQMLAFHFYTAPLEKQIGAFPAHPGQDVLYILDILYIQLFNTLSE